MSRGLRLLLLSCVCSLASATREVKVACSEEADLPCTVHTDPQGPYRVFWVKLTEGGQERMEVPQEGLRSHPQKEASLEASGEGLYLKIRNTSRCHAGTYRCTVEELDGQRNQSGTVTLKVTGCPKERKEDTFQKYRAEIVLLLALVVFYLTLIIFTCKFAQQQSIFPDFSKPVMERAFLPVTSPKKHLEPVTLPKTETV
ncbi:CD83 antigen isoform X1 [Mustela lutreola]|uniref:CD83 antigen isoform X1 n=1 Tax=Mustela lutreola TaxID=9666 RepID=UPI0027973FB9|nr:CD83 antigen isoform X1 [Mustela lutreola]